ncbi:proton-conducting transporter membrane subunit [Motilimonas sp. KMU-193]|uniref:proton-conducting transporter transmembrane domain-containing protein n=1 Tax=Motilimonas sp. KMU-193 TaxID=3388668 RepID=UPI00396B4074
MSSDTLLTLPTILSLVTATALFFSPQRQTWVSTLSLLSALIILLCSAMLLMQVIQNGPQAVAFGQWQAPFGVIFVADLFSAAMVMITAIIGLASLCYACADLCHKPSYKSYHALTHVLLAGVYGAFLTGDIFNLYVWFEVMLIASFGLMTLDAPRKQIDGAVKYVVLNLIATLVFLLAIGLIYGATGTLNLADLHQKMPLVDSNIQQLLAALLLFCFAIKAALFPVFAWLPASYPTLPYAVVGLFAALLTKVGVYALVRTFTLLFPLDLGHWQDLLLWIAGATMLVGVLGAVSQQSIKHILAFHIISQIGYMIMGLAIFTPLALAGMIFYIVHHILVKANLFFIGGVVARYQGSSRLANLGGLYLAKPALAFVFIFNAFSLAGLPPLSGFWGKYLVIKASIDASFYWLAAVALLVGLLTIISMTKIWNQAFWATNPNQSEPQSLPSLTRYYYGGAITLLTTMSLGMVIFVEPIYQFSLQATQQLMTPTPYVNAIFGAGS